MVDKLPLIFYLDDTFKRPYPFQADVAIDIDDVWEQRLKGYAQHESQMFDWLQWVDGIDPETLPKDEAGRWEVMKQRYLPKFSWQAPLFRDKLIERYGEEHASQVRYCEALEACEYGASHKGVDYRRLFPF